jgi:GGDEF domain-containing protein
MSRPAGTTLPRLVNRLLATPACRDASGYEEHLKILAQSVDADGFAMVRFHPGKEAARILCGIGLRTSRGRWGRPVESPLLVERATRSMGGPATSAKGTFEDDPYLKKEKVRSMLLRSSGSGWMGLVIIAFRRGERPFNAGERERFAALSGVINLLCGTGPFDGLHEGSGGADRLTGLGLFSDFHRALAGELSRARRSGGAVTMGIMSIVPRDHASPEDALINVSRTMQDQLRDFDTLVRYGWEELAFILPDLRSAEGIRVLDRIMGDILSSLGGVGAAPDMYLGLSSYPEEGTTVERLIEMAEAAMNRAREESLSGVHRWEG